MEKFLGKSALKKHKKAVLAVILIVIVPASVIVGRSLSSRSHNVYFSIQTKAIEASIANDFQRKLHSQMPPREEIAVLPRYLDDAFLRHGRAKTLIQFPSGPLIGHDYKSISELIEDDATKQLGADLRFEKSRFEAYDKSTGKNLNIYERKDSRTIEGLVLECDNWRKRQGRLQCEFDGGSDYGMKPFTAILFDIAYLKYQRQKLDYRNGKYQLVEGNVPGIVLDVDSLLSRNAIARIISYQLLRQTSSMLAENFKKIGQKLPVDEWGWSPIGYDSLKKYYVEKLGEWQKFAKSDLKTEVTFSKTGFAATNPETGDKIAFPRDDDLLNEALKELNYYKEKCDFVNYFQVENYPMFLLSILRLYDVNLEFDKATNKYVIAPGPTDPKRFFEIVSEFTFVNAPSDTDYLKKYLTSWLDSSKKPKKSSTTD